MSDQITVLLAFVSGLGGLEQSVDDGSLFYRKGADCAVCLKQLQRAVRRDDEATLEFRKQMGEWNVAGKHLLPLLVHYRDERKLCYEVVKLLVMLTMPVKAAVSQRAALNVHLFLAKKSFASNVDSLHVCMGLMREALGGRGLEPIKYDLHRRLLELLLHLFRNLLAIPMRASLAKSSSAATTSVVGGSVTAGGVNLGDDITDAFMLALHRVRFFDALLLLLAYVDRNFHSLEKRAADLFRRSSKRRKKHASEKENTSASSGDDDGDEIGKMLQEASDSDPAEKERSTREFNTLLAEIVHLVLRTQPRPETLAMLPEQVASEQGATDELRSLMAKERVQHTSKRKELTTAPMRFQEGLFAVRNADSGSSSSSSNHSSFESTAEGLRPMVTAFNAAAVLGASSARFVLDPTPTELSTEVHDALRRFACDFLTTSYNRVMASVRDDLRAQKNIVSSDEMVFLWLMRYMTAFHVATEKQRQLAAIAASNDDAFNFDFALVGEVLQFDGARRSELAYLAEKMSHGLERRLWSQLRLLVPTLRSLCACVELLLASSLPEARVAGRALRRKLFYVPADFVEPMRQLFCMPTKPSLWPRNFLVDIVETMHAVVQLIDAAADGGEPIMVQVRTAGANNDGDVGSYMDSDDAGRSGDEDDNERRRMRDRRSQLFDAQSYCQRMCKQSVIDNLGLLLEGYERNSDSLNGVLASFVHLIGTRCGSVALFFYVPFLVVVSRVLSDRAVGGARYALLLHVLANVGHRFIQSVKRHDMLFIEAVLPKRSDEAILYVAEDTSGGGSAIGARLAQPGSDQRLRKQTNARARQQLRARRAMEGRSWSAEDDLALGTAADGVGPLDESQASDADAIEARVMRIADALNSARGNAADDDKQRHTSANVAWRLVELARLDVGAAELCFPMPVEVDRRGGGGGGKQKRGKRRRRQDDFVVDDSDMSDVEWSSDEFVADDRSDDDDDSNSAAYAGSDPVGHYLARILEHFGSSRRRAGGVTKLRTVRAIFVRIARQSLETVVPLDATEGAALEAPLIGQLLGAVGLTRSEDDELWRCPNTVSLDNVLIRLNTFISAAESPESFASSALSDNDGKESSDTESSDNDDKESSESSSLKRSREDSSDSDSKRQRNE
jgi:Timeless protein